MNNDPTMNSPEKQARNERSELYTAAGALLLSDRVTEEPSERKGHDPEGEPIVRRTLQLTVAESPLSERVLGALELDELSLTFEPAHTNTEGLVSPSCIYLALTGNNPLARRGPSNSRVYFMDESEEEGSADVIVETEGEGKLGDYGYPDDRPATRDEVRGLRKILGAVKILA